MKTVKVWSTWLLRRAQGVEEGARVPGETLACSIPGVKPWQRAAQ